MQYPYSTPSCLAGKKKPIAHPLQDPQLAITPHVDVTNCLLSLEHGRHIILACPISLSASISALTIHPKAVNTIDKQSINGVVAGASNAAQPSLTSVAGRILDVAFEQPSTARLGSNTAPAAGCRLVCLCPRGSDRGSLRQACTARFKSLDSLCQGVKHGLDFR